jgi:hypothetical protein
MCQYYMVHVIRVCNEWIGNGRTSCRENEKTRENIKNASSGMWRRVDIVWTDISEERIASIFRVEKSASCSHMLTLVPGSRIFLPSRWRRYVPPKRRFTQDLHGATFQKTAFFVDTAVKTSNVTTRKHYRDQYCRLKVAAIATKFIIRFRICDVCGTRTRCEYYSNTAGYWKSRWTYISIAKLLPNRITAINLWENEEAAVQTDNCRTETVTIGERCKACTVFSC